MIIIIVTALVPSLVSPLFVNQFLDRRAIITKFTRKWHGVISKGQTKHDMLNLTATRFMFAIHNNEYAHTLTQASRRVQPQDLGTDGQN